MQAVAEGLVDRKELLEMFEEIHQVTMHSFEKAIQEPKVDVEDVMRRLHRASLAPCVEHVRSTSIDEIIAKSGRKQVMRKAMTQVLDELLSKYPDVSRQAFSSNTLLLHTSMCFLMQSICLPMCLSFIICAFI